MASISSQISSKTSTEPPLHAPLLVSSPLISVIIPAYNEEGYIEETLSSLKQQTLQSHEVIVVTNGCTDGTESIVRKYLNERIRHLSLPKANVSVARNAGALNARGNVLVFLDADTQLESNALGIIQQHFTSSYTVGTTKTLPDSIGWRFRAALAFKNMYNSLNLYQGCSGVLICRKEDFQKVGGYNPALVVREHRKLILSLHALGNYTVLPCTATTSMRRYQQWGLGKSLLFWAKQWVKDKRGKLSESNYETIR